MTTAVEKPQAITNEIIGLFKKYGDASYDGEPVTQSSHMIQCAMLAREEGDDDLTIGAFLHDIGHLLKHNMNTEAMGTFGVVNHEGIGAAWLAERGFSDKVCAVVANHVAAKRYLVATDVLYAMKLSAASKETLKWQGGPMTTEEALEFEKKPFFDEIIKVRLWDEKAKETEMAMLPLSYFHALIQTYLTERTRN